MDDSIVTVLITILITLFAIISQIRKKGTGPDSTGKPAGKPARDIFSEPFPTQIPDDPREVIRKFFGEVPPEPEEAPGNTAEFEPVYREGETNPEPVYETIQGEDLTEPEEIRREKEKLLSQEGIPATITYSSQAEKEAFADASVSIASAEIKGNKAYDEQFQAIHPLLQDVDWRKAIIYSEILKRRDNF
ncbi:MAG: hypothetical protein GX419_02920 [Bacteroidales bacterium]|jgi:hypothetical protein|nr:hypothetical protein [Bacteroidales bacterium]